VSSRIKKTT